MKIVHICLCGPVTDGWNYQDNLLSKYHVKLGHDVTLVTSKWIWGNNGKLEKTNSTEYVNDDQVKIIRLDIKHDRNLNFKFKRYIGLIDKIERSKPEILFVHGCQFIDIKLIARYVKEHPAVRLFVDNHADFSNSATNWLSKTILHKIIWRHYSNLIEPYVSKFYGVLPSRVDFLVNMYNLPKNKIELLVMGADDELVEQVRNPIAKDKFREKHTIAKDDILIVTGGKIDFAKQQTLLLMKAVLNIEDPRVRLIVFGPVASEMKREFDTLCDRKKVQHIDWLSTEESYECFASADLVVFPGRHSVYWEQVVGLGIPCIFKWWEGTTHVDLGGNCEFLHTDTVQEIQEKIEDCLFESKKLEKMRRVSEEMGMNIFSYKKIAERSLAEI
jgi:hypothetical protein